MTSCSTGWATWISRGWVVSVGVANCCWAWLRRVTSCSTVWFSFSGIFIFKFLSFISLTIFDLLIIILSWLIYLFKGVLSSRLFDGAKLLKFLSCFLDTPSIFFLSSNPSVFNLLSVWLRFLSFIILFSLLFWLSFIEIWLSSLFKDTSSDKVLSSDICFSCNTFFSLENDLLFRYSSSLDGESSSNFLDSLLLWISLKLDSGDLWSLSLRFKSFSFKKSLNLSLLKSSEKTILSDSLILFFPNSGIYMFSIVIL